MSVLPRIALFFMFSHGIHGIHRTFLQYILPQIYTEPSCCMFSHGIHGIHRTFLLYILPQIAQIFTDAAFKGVHLSVSICAICGRILSATSSVNSVKSVGEYLGRVISAGELPVNLLLAMLAQIGIALREVVVAEPPATVGRQR